MCKTDKSQIAQDILRYLVKHPHAQDTIEGIYEWWLLEEQIARRTAQVKEALAELVGDGLVVESVGKDSRTHYQVNRRRYAQILARLSQGADGAGSGDGAARR
jgi:hypothetical protein